MDNIGPAILLTQPLVRRSSVDQHDAARSSGVSGFQKALRIGIGNDK
jgi:hypothetical protein